MNEQASEPTRPRSSGRPDRERGSHPVEAEITAPSRITAPSDSSDGAPDGSARGG